MSSERREWLEMLIATPGAYAQLLDSHGGCLAPAAHELASARLEVHHGFAPPPNAVEVWAAARDIAEQAGLLDVIPTARALAADCMAAGLLVLGLHSRERRR